MNKKVEVPIDFEKEKLAIEKTLQLLDKRITTVSKKMSKDNLSEAVDDKLIDIMGNLQSQKDLYQTILKDPKSIKRYYIIDDNGLCQIIHEQKL